MSSADEGMTDAEIGYIEGYCMTMLKDLKMPEDEQKMLRNACAQAKRYTALRASLGEPVAWRLRRDGQWIYFETQPDDLVAEALCVRTLPEAAKEG